MTTAAKIVYALALAVGLSLGAFIGYQRDSSLRWSLYSAQRLTAPREFDDYSLLQYRHADHEHARVALIEFAAFLEELENRSHEMRQKLGLANTYTRLSLLEDAANNPQASDDYIKKAQYWRATSGAPAHSDSELKSAVSDLDKRLEKFGLP